MRDAVIVSTARTPIGKAYRGAFNNTHAVDLGGHVISQAVSVLPDDILFGGFIDKAHLQVRAEHSLGTQQMLQARGGDTGAVEIRIVRPEMQHRRYHHR